METYVLAIHERPDDEKRDLITYICNPKHRTSANQCIEFLKKFPLKVWETQYPKPLDYTCWYISFTYNESFIRNEKPWILNFTIRPSYTVIEYRHPQFIPDYLLDRMQWQTNNWKYEKLTSETENDVTKTMEIYLDKIKEPFKIGKLKQGGQSFAEGFVTNLITDAFEGQLIERNRRPEWLRGKKGKCLELDIFMPKMNLAIEIQGLQHSVDLCGKPQQLIERKENDLFKKRVCNENGVKLIWMDWEGVNNCLMRAPREKRLESIRTLINDFTRSNYSFLKWKNSIDLLFE